MEKKKRIRWTELRNLETEKERIKWFIKFNEDHGITSLDQLTKTYPGLRLYYFKLSKEGKEKIFSPKQRDWYSELNNLSEEEKVKWFIKFNKSNGIISLQQLSKEYPRLRIYYYELSKENKEKIFTPIYHDWYSELNNLSEEEKVKWFIKFNKNNGIISLQQLSKEYSSLRIYYYELSKENREKIFTPVHHDWYSELKDLSEKEKIEWFIKFMRDHKITSLTEFNQKYSRLAKYYHKLPKESQREIASSKQRDWYSELNNLSEEEKVKWFIKFRDDEGITSATELRNKYPGLVKYYKKFSLENKEKIFRSKHRDWSAIRNLSTEEEKVEWFIKFRDDEGLTSITELYRKYPRLTLYYNGLSKESREKIFQPKIKDWSTVRNLSTEEEKVEWIIKFCDENEITSATQLHIYGILWLIYRSFSKENREKIFTPIISRGEETLGKVLTEAGYSFTTQKKYPDLRSDKGGVLRYDIYIKQKNCLIEFHGSQHFDPNVGWYDEEAIERDKIKYQYAKDHNIPLFYITNCIEEYKKYGYFTEVLVDWDELMEKIDSIPDVEVVVEE